MHGGSSTSSAFELRVQADGGTAFGRWRLGARTVNRLISRRRRKRDQAGNLEDHREIYSSRPTPGEDGHEGADAEDSHGEDSSFEILPGQDASEEHSGRLPASSGSHLLAQRQASMLGHPFGGRLSGGIRQWNPTLYRWISEHMGTRAKASLLVSLMLLQAMSFVLQDNTKPAWARGINTWSIQVVEHAVALVIAFTVSMLLDCCWAMDKIFSWHPLWRFVGVSALFTLATWFTQQAYKQDICHAAVELLGYLYVPLATILSYAIFRRRYGVLEWLSIGMMTLAACTFMLLRERYVAGGTDGAVAWIRSHFNAAGVALVLCSVISSVLGCVYAESIFKEKDTRLKRKWAVGNKTLGHDRFYIMKVHIEFSALLISLLGWSLPQAWSKAINVDTFDEWFGPWSYIEVFNVCIYVALSWVAGLVTQQMNTVVKAIAQTIANIVCVMIADPILHDRYRFDLRAAPELMLAIIVLMSAIIFQTGRIIIRRLKGEMQSSHQPLPAVGASEEDSVNDDEDGPNGLFSTAPELPSPRAVTHLSTIKSSESGRIPSRSERFANYACIVIYIFVDCGRTLLNSYALTSSTINPTTMSFLGFVAGVVLATGLTAWHDGVRGVKSAYRVRKCIETLPAASLFAVGQCLTSFAYVLHISPALANVLGKIYTPLAAFGGRCILDRYYSWLEYFAIVILTLASLTFGYLQEYSMAEGLRFASCAAMACAVGSAVFSAFGSLAMEKILQAKNSGENEPYRIQKVRLDFGSALSTLVLLPAISLISKRPKDSIWVSRPWGSNCTECNPVIPSSLPHWPWQELEQSCSSAVCTGACMCLPSVIVGWNDMMLLLALLVNVAQGWLIGRITKQFSTIHRAIADAFSTLLLYWVGEPVVDLLAKGTPYIDSIKDLCLDMVSFVVPLSTMTFMVATSQMKEVMEAVSSQNMSDSSECLNSDTSHSDETGESRQDSDSGSSED